MGLQCWECDLARLADYLQQVCYSLYVALNKARILQSGCKLRGERSPVPLLAWPVVPGVPGAMNRQAASRKAIGAVV